MIFKLTFEVYTNVILTYIKLLKIYTIIYDNAINNSTVADFAQLKTF